jgi:hypothetical protein
MRDYTFIPFLYKSGDKKNQLLLRCPLADSRWNTHMVHPFWDLHSIFIPI